MENETNYIENVDYVLNETVRSDDYLNNELNSLSERGKAVIKLIVENSKNDIMDTITQDVYANASINSFTISNRNRIKHLIDVAFLKGIAEGVLQGYNAISEKKDSVESAQETGYSGA